MTEPPLRWSRWAQPGVSPVYTARDYRVRRPSRHVVVLEFRGLPLSKHDSIASAKAAAEAHWTERRP